MVCYICHNDNRDNFKFLNKKADLPFKIISKDSWDINEALLVSADYKAFDYVILDCSVFNKNTEEEVRAALLAFKAIYSCRVVIFAEGVEPGNGFLQWCAKTGLYNIVTATNKKLRQEEIQCCLNGAGMAKIDAEKWLGEEYQYMYKTLDEIKEERHISFPMKENNAKINFAGTEHHIGTTTVTSQLAWYLNERGASIALLLRDINPELYTQRYSKVKQDERGIYNYENIDFINLSETLSKDYDFIIEDQGVLAETNKEAFLNGDVAVLVSGQKPWELPHLKSKLSDLLSHGSRGIHLLFNFVEKDERAKMEDEFRDQFRTIQFLKYSSKPYTGEPNRVFLKNLMGQYISEEEAREVENTLEKRTVFGRKKKKSNQ